MEEVRERRVLKLWVRISMFIIISIGIILPLFGMYVNIKHTKKETNKTLYTANINKNAKYKVSLYNNSFTDTTEMEEDKVYISDLVKNINFNILYSYSGNKSTKLNYKYDVKAKLYGQIPNSETGGNDKVWEKDYTLVESKKGKANGASFNISETLDVNFPKYTEEVKNFRKRFGMDATTALKITMNVNVTGKYENKKIDKKDEINLEIPLGIQAFSIKKDFKQSDFLNIYSKSTSKNKTIPNGIFIFLSSMFLILFLLTFRVIFNIKPKSAYTKELDKILKNYGSIIVEVKNAVKENGYNIQTVKNFEEMVDLEEELRIPIILYENIYSYTANFSITYNDTIYKYVLKNRDH